MKDIIKRITIFLCGLFLLIFSFIFGPENVYWSHKYAYISETVQLRHFITEDEYHYHCTAFDLGYLDLTLSDLRRSNQGQIGKNRSYEYEC